MKKLLIALAAVLVTVASYGQGELTFATRITGDVDAPVLLGPSNATGPGPAYSAALYLVTGGNATLIPGAVTTFQAAGTGAKAILDRYVTPLGASVVVPGVTAGSPATLRMVAWQTSSGATYEAAKAAAPLLTAASKDFTVTLGGGLNPPANLNTGLSAAGLQGFNIPGVPEPSTIALGVLGAAALLLRRRK